MTNTLPAHPKPRPFTTRGLALALAALSVFALVYVLVVREYQVEGDLVVTGNDTSETVDVTAIAEPVEFDARTNTVTVRFKLEVLNSSLLDDGLRLNEGVRVTVNGADGTQEFRFPQGEPIGNIEAELGTSGEVYAYPFDTHEGFISLFVETFQRQAGGVNETTGQLSASLDMEGAVSGWSIKADLSRLAGFPLVTFTLERAFSTVAFAFVLVMMAVSVVVLALIVSVLAVTNRRRFEVALLTWNGAILFALPLLRTYLPGSPPIGAAMDIYLYLWTFVIAVSSLILMIIAWSRQRKADLIEERGKLGVDRHD